MVNMFCRQKSFWSVTVDMTEHWPSVGVIDKTVPRRGHDNGLDPANLIIILTRSDPNINNK